MLRNGLTFLYEQRGGLIMLLICVLSAIFFVRYIAWIFCWGRFKNADAGSSTGAPSARSDNGIGFIIVEFFVNLINDFRHLLALVLVLIFAGVLAISICRAGNDIEKLTKAIEVVTATLGGLVGSIIGYYFGESAVKRSSRRAISSGSVEQSPPTEASENDTIQQAPPPPQG